MSSYFNILSSYILFYFIEFDSIAATRGGLEDGMSSRRLLSELLLQLTEQKQIQAQESKELQLQLQLQVKNSTGNQNNRDSISNDNNNNRNGVHQRNRNKNKRSPDMEYSYNGKKTLRIVSASQSLDSGERPSQPQRSYSGLGLGVKHNICIDMDLEGRSGLGLGSEEIMREERDMIRDDIGQNENYNSNTTSNNHNNLNFDNNHDNNHDNNQNINDDNSDNDSENDENQRNNENVNNKNKDGLGHGLVVIAATNRLEDIDPAVVRRFESRVYVGVPEYDTRVAMVINFLR